MENDIHKKAAEILKREMFDEGKYSAIFPLALFLLAFPIAKALLSLPFFNEIIIRFSMEKLPPRTPIGNIAPWEAATFFASCALSALIAGFIFCYMAAFLESEDQRHWLLRDDKLRDKNWFAMMGVASFVLSILGLVISLSKCSSP